MMKVHEKLIDINQIKAYNAIKEQKLKAFATYLLIAWLTSNIIFAQVVSIVSDLSWEVRTGWRLVLVLCERDVWEHSCQGQLRAARPAGSCCPLRNI